MRKSLRTIKNEKGILTIDFLFAFMMVFGFTSLLYSFAFTLSVVEVVQYISFATARNYALAHSSETEQRARAEQKFAELSQDPTITPFITSGWFTIRDVLIGDVNDEFP
ncbi:MAG: hypothetical protein MJK18_00430, partial [Bdellovibrionales bacterium]|nr:hypothetical protein [Bdellovibrionales bacterium]